MDYKPNLLTAPYFLFPFIHTFISPPPAIFLVFINPQVAPLCKVLQVHTRIPQRCRLPSHTKRLQDAAVTWGAEHKPSIDSALERLKKDAKDHPQQTGSSKVAAASSAPFVRRSSEPDVATAFAVSSGVLGSEDHGALKKKPVKPQPPPGSKVQVSAAFHRSAWSSKFLKFEARTG